jgi:hypothetical protein
MSYLELNDKLNINNSKDLIIIYCSPKVGSTSLVSSLRLSCNDNFNVLHLHDDPMLRILTQSDDSVSISGLIEYNSKLKKVYVMDIYRSPIERKMSEYFEKLCDLHFNNTPEKVNNYSIDKIIKRFNDIFNHIGIGDHYIDKYDIPVRECFDIKNKYLMQEINNVTYIKLRLKDSGEWSEILSNILNRKITIVRDYETVNKEIGDLYKRFKSEYKVPLNHYQSIIEDEYLLLYYTKEEREEYLKEWFIKICDKCETWSIKEYDFYKRISIENLSQNDIQRHHYIDLGCTCKCCSTKRLEIMEKIERGEEIKEKIIHTELVKNEQYKILLAAKQKQKPANRKLQFSMKR